MTDFAGCTAVVTGGSSGIGFAVVRELLERGAQVASLDRQPLNFDHERCLEVHCDVGDSDSVQAALDTALDHFGALDILVNNAGIGATGDVAANSDSEWMHGFNVNVLGAVRLSRTALPHLRLSSKAAIVNTSSIVAKVGVPERALYSATKGALSALTLAMAADFVACGIRVNAVLPGTADTPWVGRLLEQAPDPEGAAADLRRRQPLGRLVSADEVAAAIAHLASPRNSSTTGSLLCVDGGMSGLRAPVRAER